MEKYCLKNNVAFKILLIIDNAPGHPPILSDLHPHIKVVLFPPNIASSFQAVSQGVIAACKAYYLSEIFVQAVAAAEGDTDAVLEK